MPRKAKEKTNELNVKEKKVVDVSEKKSKVVKTSSKSKKTTESKTTAKSKTTKKSSISKSASSTKSNRKSKVSKTPTITTEYYDLPFRYNQTIVKILAQTPNTLFIYWDISDEDRQSYLDKYGTDFFIHTKPYLLIINETMHYTFEVDINDFANSWYLHVNDANCEYKVELRRKFIADSNHDISLNHDTNFESYRINDCLYITSSNEIEAPNNHILFDKLGSSVFFRNVKTNITEEQNISSLSFLQKIGKVYNIYDLYKEIYYDDLVSDELGVNLPSSSSSSSFK